MTKAGLSAPVDASWSSGGRGGKKWHISTDDGMAVCDPHQTPLFMEMAEDPNATAPGERCRKNGCRERWPKKCPLPGCVCNPRPKCPCSACRMVWGIR